MNRYLEMKRRHQAEIDAFPIKWAFSEEQFANGMRELGLEPSDTDQVIGIGCGGFIRKADRESLRELFDRHRAEHRAALDGDATGSGYAYEMFRCELDNHEYAYTEDDSDTLESCGVTEEMLAGNAALAEALRRAKRDCLRDAI